MAVWFIICVIASQKSIDKALASCKFSVWRLIWQVVTDKIFKNNVLPYSYSFHCLTISKPTHCSLVFDPFT